MMLEWSLTSSLFRIIRNIVIYAALAITLATGLAWGESLKAGIEYARGNYHIGPGDVLSLHVYHQPDFSQQNILVRDDGFASFNGVGEIPVAGKTLQDVSLILRDRIGELVIDPIVNLSLAQSRPGTVYVAGAVRHPGPVQLQSSSSSSGTETVQKPQTRMPLRLSNVLAGAGGVTLNADLSRVEVTMASTGEVVRVNLWEMISQASGSADLQLQSGDSVYVPALANGATLSESQQNLLLSSALGPGNFPVRVIGEVTTPGIYQLNSDSPYLNTAIAMAGGYKDSANKKLIAIRRFTDNTPATLYLDPGKSDVMLRPNDVIFISEHSVYKAGRFFETVSKILAPFTNAALGFAWFAR